jgi:hypothetical protein
MLCLKSSPSKGFRCSSVQCCLHSPNIWTVLLHNGGSWNAHVTKQSFHFTRKPKLFRKGQKIKPLITFIVYCSGNKIIKWHICCAIQTLLLQNPPLCSSTICVNYKEHLQINTTWLSGGTVRSMQQSVNSKGLCICVSVSTVDLDTESTPRTEPDGKWSFTAHARTFFSAETFTIGTIGFLHCILCTVCCILSVFHLLPPPYSGLIVCIICPLLVTPLFAQNVFLLFASSSFSLFYSCFPLKPTDYYCSLLRPFIFSILGLFINWFPTMPFHLFTYFSTR